ncbi:DMT family transporter [Wenxinia saemankumensis]|uniref:EamA-like transporter family protein n=1 Tax=Wenxinia saemankumensis TaxID=1447782 RepID=A0A1M6FIK8_9RHOB|nr:DMT family transporter [Wenxinia saemankumensis]SHI97525.1 EamA-like transporter family protein [Wenxinia saemankumensis]
MPQLSPAAIGALSAVIAVTAFSVNDMAIKFLSGGYALHQVVLIRTLFGLTLFFAVILPLSGGLSALRTRRPVMHALRGCCVVFANMTFFLGLAALPLAEGVAIFFVSPLIITVFSVIFLGETVGPRRWTAIALGLVGVVIVLRPGTEAFRPAALLPILAAFGYASLHMLTRAIGRTETTAAMSFYIQATFVVVSLVMGAILGTGRFAGSEDASLVFLTRAWDWPVLADLPVFAVVGAASAIGGFFISHAYRTSEAALVAPFEYLALPLSVIWGFAVFDERPDAVALMGIALILGSGLAMIWLEARSRRAEVPATPRYRR